MEYRCISADCHIDLCWLPHDLFVSNASQAMKDRMPYVIQGSDGPMWVTKSGLNLGFANGKGGTGAVGSGDASTSRARNIVSIAWPPPASMRMVRRAFSVPRRPNCGYRIRIAMVSRPK